MMVRLSSMPLLLLVLLLQVVHTSSTIDSYTPEVEKFDAPSLSIRGALKAAIDHDYEDVIVMQTEMAWGAQEMKRYKTIRGEWPVRSSLDETKLRPDSSSADGGDVSLFRGNGETRPPTTADGRLDYWSYLVSIF